MSGYTKICVRLNDYEINYGKIYIKALVQGRKAGPHSRGKERVHDKNRYDTIPFT